MRLSDLHQRLADLGARPVHRDVIIRAWLQGLPLDTGRRHQPTDDFLPKSVRQGLPQLSADLDALAAQVATQHGLKDLRLSPTATGFSVDMIAAAQPGQGAGTAAMQNLIDYADQRGLRIELTPAQKGDPNGTTSRGRLVKFYKGLGFVENKGRAKDFSTTAGMVREPKALQQSNPAAAPSKPSPETIELRKREKVLQRLLECLA